MLVFVPALPALYALCDLGQIAVGWGLSCLTQSMGIITVIYLSE